MKRRKRPHNASIKRSLVFVGVAVVVVFSGCEALFTTNLFENFARNPENMSEEQLVAYGNEAIASGDREKMASAFDSLSKKDLSDDPDARNTLVELGIGATDIVSVVRDNIEDPEGVSEEEFDEERREIARETADIMLEADSEDFSPDRWVYAAAGVGISALDEGEDWERNLENSDKKDRHRVKGLLTKAAEGYEREERRESDIYTQIQDLQKVTE